MSDIVATITEKTNITASISNRDQIIVQVTDGHIHHNKQAIDGINSDLLAQIEAATTTYIHDQMVASAEWTIRHNLKKFPAVSVVDSAGNVVIGEVRYIDINAISIKFIGAFSGKAYLN